jgi:hypothetical protein
MAPGVFTAVDYDPDGWHTEDEYVPLCTECDLCQGHHSRDHPVWC